MIEYEYKDVRQFQTGARDYEKLPKTGHLEFAIGDTFDKGRIVAIRNLDQIRGKLDRSIPGTDELAALGSHP